MSTGDRGSLPTPFAGTRKGRSLITALRIAAAPLSPDRRRLPVITPATAAILRYRRLDLGPTEHDVEQREWLHEFGIDDHADTSSNRLV